MKTPAALLRDLSWHARHWLCSAGKRHILTEQEGRPLPRRLSPPSPYPRRAMMATSQTALEFALGHLRWCLEQPLGCGDLTWAARAGRAIERLADAWERRIRL